MEKIRDKHKKLDALISIINMKALAFNNIVFFEGFTKKVNFSSFEICFQDSYIWLNILFVESGSQNLKFVKNKIKDFGLPMSDSARSAPDLVHSLRTVKGHLMRDTEPEDVEKENFCREWYKRNCGKEEPQTDGEWRACLDVLLDCCLEYLQEVESCIDHMVEDPFPDLIQDGWNKQRSRNYSLHDWTEVTEEVLKAFGMEALDAYKVANTQLDKWREQLHYLKDGFDFRTEARRIIEAYVVKGDFWPGTARDLMSLGIDQGPELFKAIKAIKAMFNESPCSLETLLERFQNEYLSKK